MLTAQTIQSSIKLAHQSSRPLLQVIQESTGLEQAELAKALAELWQLPYLTMQDLYAFEVQLEQITYVDAVKKHCVVVKNNEGQLLVVIDNPLDGDLQDWVNAKLKVSTDLAVASTGDILALLKKHEDGMFAMHGLVDQRQSQVKASGELDNLSLVSINADNSHVVKLVNSTLYDALKTKASDIHLEVDAHGLIIKYRLDGVLEIMANIEGVDVAEQVISRIKIMSELDIAERRVPQDGRFKISIQNREVDFRVSIMPSVFGEDAVLRILDRSTITNQVKDLRLEQLGFDIETIRKIRKMVLEPYGMVLVTGPTGSGKTTTLYAAISETNNGKDKIITIEDPVEYQLSGVLQIPVNEKKGLTFVRGLRFILRYDPDKIMVGEIRDVEIAQIVI
jgi:general secretion pathway protein E